MKKDILFKLKEVMPALANDFGIEELAVSGSIATGDYTEHSDGDIAILKMKKKNGLLLVRAKRYLTGYLGKTVDIGLYDDLRPFIKKRVKKELIYVK